MTGIHRPIRPGSTAKKREADARVRQRIQEEKARHRAKLLYFSDLEREVLLVANLELRSVRLDRIRHQRTEEDRRHKAAIEKLNNKFKR